MNPEELLALFLKALPYTPIVYKQSLFSTNQSEYGTSFELEYKHTDIPDDSLLFFVPSVSSADGDCKLVVKIPIVQSDGTTVYSSSEFDIIVEQNDDLPRPAGKGDIIASRMCIFRFRKSRGQVILCNSPLYNDAIFSNIKVTNAKFLNLPEYVDPQNPQITYTLVSTKEFNALQEEVIKLKNRIRYGTQDPEEALVDAPYGTVYIQHESD